MLWMNLPQQLFLLFASRNSHIHCPGWGRCCYNVLTSRVHCLQSSCLITVMICETQTCWCCCLATHLYWAHTASRAAFEHLVAIKSWRSLAWSHVLPSPKGSGVHRYSCQTLRKSRPLLPFFWLMYSFLPWNSFSLFLWLSRTSTNQCSSCLLSFLTISLHWADLCIFFYHTLLYFVPIGILFSVFIFYSWFTGVYLLFTTLEFAPC